MPEHTTMNTEQGLLPMARAQRVGFDGGDGVEGIIAFVGAEKSLDGIAQVVAALVFVCWAGSLRGECVRLHAPRSLHIDESIRRVMAEL